MPYGSVSPACPAVVPGRPGVGGQGRPTVGGARTVKYGGRVGEARDDRKDRPDDPDDFCGDAASRREAQSARAGARPRTDGPRTLRELEPTYQSRGMIPLLIRPPLCRLRRRRDTAPVAERLDAPRKGDPVAGALGGERMRPVGDDQSHDCGGSTDVVLRITLCEMESPMSAVWISGASYGTGTTGRTMREGRAGSWKTCCRATRAVVALSSGSPVLRLRSQRGSCWR